MVPVARSRNADGPPGRGGRVPPSSGPRRRTPPGRPRPGRRRAPRRPLPRAAAAPRPAARADRIASRPSGPENNARCGSWSRASGATDSHASSGMYGGLQVITSTSPISSSKAVARSPRRSSTPEPSRLRSAQAWASGSSSTAYTRREGCLGGDREGDGSGSGGEVDDGRLLHRGRLLDRPPGEQLRLGPGHEDPRPDGELDVAEVGAAGEVLERLAGGAAPDQAGVLLGGGRSAPRRRAPAGRAWCRARGRAARPRRARGSRRRRRRARGSPRSATPALRHRLGHAVSPRAPRGEPRGPR